MSSIRLNTRLHSTSSTDAGLAWLLRAVQWTLYGCLAVLRPFVVIGLAAVTGLGLLASAFYGLLVRGSHFPFGFVLMVAFGAAVGLVLFHQFVSWLRPK
jgi:hypothetical protein